MQHVALYGLTTPHSALYDWPRAAISCAASFKELCQRFCPEALPLALRLAKADPFKYRDIVPDYPEAVFAYLRSMRGRIVETSHHVVFDGLVFVAGEVIAIDTTARRAELSCYPGKWGRYYSDSTIQPCENMASDYVARILEIRRALLAEMLRPGSYLSRIVQDIQGIIGDYIPDPSYFLIQRG